jgi:hypothetical protein
MEMMKYTVRDCFFTDNDRCADAVCRDVIYGVSTVGMRGSQKMIGIEILRNWK